MGTFGAKHNPEMLVLQDLGIEDGDAAGAVGYPVVDVTFNVWDAMTGTALPDVVLPGTAKGEVPEFVCSTVVTTEEGGTAVVSVDAILMRYYPDRDTVPPDVSKAALFVSREGQLAGLGTAAAAAAATKRADDAYALATLNGPGSPGPAGPSGVGVIMQAADGSYDETKTQQLKLLVGTTPPPAQPAADKDVRVAIWAVTSA